MNLTLSQAAQILGKTRRQIEYMIRNNRLTASKVGGRWVVDSDLLPLSAGQQKAYQRKTAALRNVVEELFDNEAPRTRYSMRDLKAFHSAVEIYGQLKATLPEENKAMTLLRQALDELSMGCHRYHRSQKLEAYARARDYCSLSACELIVMNQDSVETSIQRIEQQLIPSISGLMRRQDRSGRDT